MADGFDLVLPSEEEVAQSESVPRRSRLAFGLVIIGIALGGCAFLYNQHDGVDTLQVGDSDMLIGLADGGWKCGKNCEKGGAAKCVMGRKYRKIAGQAKRHMTQEEVDKRKKRINDKCKNLCVPKPKGKRGSPCKKAPAEGAEPAEPDEPAEEPDEPAETGE